MNRQKCSFTFIFLFFSCSGSSRFFVPSAKKKLRTEIPFFCCFSSLFFFIYQEPKQERYQVMHLHRGLATMPLDIIQAKAVYKKQRTMAVDLVMVDGDGGDDDPWLDDWASFCMYGCLLAFLASADDAPMLTSSLMR